jgi:V/A-type H+-transporting ATPase subunit C
MRHAYGASLIRALEGSLLSRKTLDAMARATDAAEALEELSETTYATHMAPGQRVADFEQILQRMLEEAYRLLRRLILDDDLEQGMLRVHDFHNLKAVMKASLAGVEPKGLVRLGVVDPATIRAAAESGDYATIPPDMAEIARRVARAYEMVEDPRLLEVVLDGAAVGARVAALTRLNTPVMPDYAALLADTTNIRTLARVSRMNAESALFETAFIPGGRLNLDRLRAAVGKGSSAVVEACANTLYAKAMQEGLSYLQDRKSFAVLDRELENLLVAKLRETQFVFFSPAPIIAFVLAREHEVSMVRLVMVAKINGIPSDLIAARLPMLYG